MTQGSPAEPFALVLLPDTQYYTWTNPPDRLEMFHAQTGWIASNATALGIQFVLHLGDITEHTEVQTTNAVLEWERAHSCMARLDGIVPYAAACGNHDFWRNPDQSRNTTLYNQTFPLSLYTNQPWFGGVKDTGRLENAYFYFSAGGLDWMVIMLEDGPREEVLEWANGVVASNQERKVILLTHTYLYLDGTWHGLKPEHLWNPHYGHWLVNDGLEIWDKLVRRHANIALTFNGHVLGVAHSVVTGDYGNLIYQIEANYQANGSGGSGYLRHIVFDPTQRQVRVQTYSPYLDRYLVDSSNEFTLVDVPFFDLTPPDPPTQLAVVTCAYDRCTLAWQPGSGGPPPSRYVVYRNDREVAICREPLYTDTGLEELTTNRYEVAAVSAGGIWSERAGPLLVVTPADETPPSLQFVAVLGDDSHGIRVGFDEPVDPQTLAKTNFSVGRGVAVNAVIPWGNWSRWRLVTTELQPGVRYPFRAQGIRDCARAGNLMPPATNLIVTWTPDLLCEEFNDPALPGWTAVSEGTAQHPHNQTGVWVVVDHKLYEAALNFGPEWGTVLGRRGTYVYYDPPEARAWSNYTVEATIRGTDGGGGIGLMFRYLDASNYYKFEAECRNNFRKLVKVVDGRETLLARVWEGYPMGKDLAFKVEAVDQRFRVWLDGEDVFGEITDGDLSHGTVALYTWKCRAFFDHVRVRPPLPQLLVDELSPWMGTDFRARIAAADPYDDLLEPADVLADDDFDGDGCSNFEEFIAGTDPTLDSSALAVALSREPLAPENPVWTISWPSQTGRVYTILRTTNLLQSFEPLAAGIPAAPPLNTFTDTAPPACAVVVYQLQVGLDL